MMQRNIEDIYELSPLQQGLLFHTLLSPELGEYYEQISCTIGGDFEVEAWKTAGQDCLSRPTATPASMLPLQSRRRWCS